MDAAPDGRWIGVIGRGQTSSLVLFLLPPPSIPPASAPRTRGRGTNHLAPESARFEPRWTDLAAVCIVEDAMLSAHLMTRVKPMPNGTVHAWSRAGSSQPLPTDTLT